MLNTCCCIGVSFAKVRLLFVLLLSGVPPPSSIPVNPDEKAVPQPDSRPPLPKAMRICGDELSSGGSARRLAKRLLPSCSTCVCTSLLQAELHLQRGRRGRRPPGRGRPLGGKPSASRLQVLSLLLNSAKGILTFS